MCFDFFFIDLARVGTFSKLLRGYLNSKTQKNVINVNIWMECLDRHKKCKARSYLYFLTTHNSKPQHHFVLTSQAETNPQGYTRTPPRRHGRPVHPRARRTHCAFSIARIAPTTVLPMLIPT